MQDFCLPSGRDNRRIVSCVTAVAKEGGQKTGQMHSLLNSHSLIEHLPFNLNRQEI